MHIAGLMQIDETTWQVGPTGAMRVPVVIYADANLIEAMDDKVYEQARNVSTLPGIVAASFVMPDAHWGYGFPIGGVAAFDASQGGVVSAGGVGFDISCGVRSVTTGILESELATVQDALADSLARAIPAGVGSEGSISLDAHEVDAMLLGGAVWAVAHGLGDAADLERIEEGGCMAGAQASCVPGRAKERQRREMGTLGSGNHYLEIQAVEEIFDSVAAAAFGLVRGEVLITIHCGSRGLGHQIGTEFLTEMVIASGAAGTALPERELACAPIESELGCRYLGAMRAAINCALANREILDHLARRVIRHFFPAAAPRLLFDVSHNTCKVETHLVAGHPRTLYVHRKGATRAFGPGHPSLPDALRSVGQPVLVGGSMGTGSYVLVGMAGNEERAFASACHGAGRAMSRHSALRRWDGQQIVDDLAAHHILVRSRSMRGVAEEAPGAYKDVGAVVLAAERAGLARRVARLRPVICIKG